MEVRIAQEYSIAICQATESRSARQMAAGVFDCYDRNNPITGDRIEQLLELFNVEHVSCSSTDHRDLVLLDNLAPVIQSHDTATEPAIDSDEDVISHLSFSNLHLAAFSFESRSQKRSMVARLNTIQMP